MCAATHRRTSTFTVRWFSTRYPCRRQMPHGPGLKLIDLCFHTFVENIPKKCRPNKLSFHCILTLTQIQRRKYNNAEYTVVMVGANGSNGNGQNGDHAARVGTIRVKQGLAQMLKGGVIVSRFSRIDDFIWCWMRTPIRLSITFPFENREVLFDLRFKPSHTIYCLLNSAIYWSIILTKPIALCAWNDRWTWWTLNKPKLPKRRVPLQSWH